MTLSFSSFEVENEILCRYDVVEVYDGKMADQKRIGRLCGDVTPPKIAATSNIMSVYFSSDNNREKKGYNGTFQAFDCNTTLTATSGVITSPGYPQGYFNNLYCWLTIVGEPGTFISL
ncbi:neuropilin-2-like isoform X2 [Physella acuta]|uniref:neuropilin-2-like isoform X1 n=1 Tax=Physella acuta TaxID=109671 RepID=UPI0027DCE3CD|nr:neuropilin-2-like isoform X1 [Physella acuta]XP_059144952.1 neuropilin-2-like isoform X2 [Physella acuta]